jgi:MYXO-CTERM domain-containing protein
MEGNMSRKFIALSIGALLLGPVAAHATVMSGSFTGTMTAGTDEDNLFGTGNTDLTGDAVTGTFVYDTTLFTPAAPVNGTAPQQYTGTSTGALTVTLTISGVTYTFQDRANSGIYLDPTSNSEVTLTANDTATNVSATFELDVALPDTPFVTSSNLTGTYNATALGDSIIQGSDFQIINSDPTEVVSGGTFNVNSISVQQQSQATPEPASLAVLAVGLAGIAGIRRRRVKG